MCRIEAFPVPVLMGEVKFRWDFNSLRPKFGLRPKSRPNFSYPQTLCVSAKLDVTQCIKMYQNVVWFYKSPFLSTADKQFWAECETFCFVRPRNLILLDEIHENEDPYVSNEIMLYKIGLFKPRSY